MTLVYNFENLSITRIGFSLLKLKCPFILILSHFFCENPCVCVGHLWYLPFKRIWIAISMSLTQCFSQSEYSEGFYRYIGMNTQIHLSLYGKTFISHYYFCPNSLYTLQN